MAYDIVTIGALLCEVMRKELDKPLDKPADFTGPYPSGDTPIMINAAAKLGANCAMIGTVGNDGFGKCVVDRLEENGVDCEMVSVHPSASTGVAFVCYFSDGSRNFLYHVHHAAPGMMTVDNINYELLEGAKWVHITGFTMSINEKSAEAVYDLMKKLPESTKISFDPNIRPEALSVEQIKELCFPVIERANIIFPSKTEAAMFTGCATDDEGCRLWAASGKIVVLKNGKSGSRVYFGQEIVDVASYEVEEIDPTGAGDTFCGAFLTALCEGKSYQDCAEFANAAGAMSVRKLGPMEGAPGRSELDKFIAKHKE